MSKTTKKEGGNPTPTVGGETTPNLALWERVEQTNPKYVKEVSYGGRKFSSIDAQYKLKKATREFGAMGIGWGVEDEEYEKMPLGDDVLGTILVFYRANLWFLTGNKRGVIPIASSVKLRYFTNARDGRESKEVVDEDAFKKVQTDALTKGLSKLGFNADIFLGKWEDNHYVSRMQEEFAQENTDIKDAISKLKKAKTLDELKKVWGALSTQERGIQVVETEKDAMKKKLEKAARSKKPTEPAKAE